jgi:hypothetical protein
MPIHSNPMHRVEGENKIQLRELPKSKCGRGRQVWRVAVGRVARFAKIGCDEMAETDRKISSHRYRLLAWLLILRLHHASSPHSRVTFFAAAVPRPAAVASYPAEGNASTGTRVPPTTRMKPNVRRRFVAAAVGQPHLLHRPATLLA